MTSCRSSGLHAATGVVLVGAVCALASVHASSGDRQHGSSTRVVTSGDGTRIAYDVIGTGPPVMLLHGGGQTRRMWHDLGYVDRLRGRYTVITVDMRGSGESDKPVVADAYAIERLRADLMAVADAAGVRRFALWGFSYGANIGRYLAVHSERVSTLAVIGIPFGPAASGVFRQTILEMQTKWRPVLEAQREGRFDPNSLSELDRATWNRGAVALNLAWLGAMLDYPSVVPADLKCPTLWLVGSANAGAMENVKEYEGKLSSTSVTLAVLPGLTHPQEIERVDLTLPLLEKFTSSRDR